MRAVFKGRERRREDMFRWVSGRGGEERRGRGRSSFDDVFVLTELFASSSISSRNQGQLIVTISRMDIYICTEIDRKLHGSIAKVLSLRR
jgi:hypothetical protein